MTLFERGLSTGLVSVGELLDGTVPAGSGPHDFTVTDAVEAMATGGWPDNLDLSADDAFDANVGYLDVIVNTDVQRVDRTRRDAGGVSRLLTSYARNLATDATLRTISRTGELSLSEAPFMTTSGSCGGCF